VIKPLLLDTGPLGKIAHPRPNPELLAWLVRMLRGPAKVIIPEITDFELRRNLLLEGLMESVRRLDELKAVLTYLPLSTRVMLRAAEFWARARKDGKPSADPKELDVDVILAAQAHEVRGIVVTENVGHLALFVEAKDWGEIE
jgi:predicted nucleic acid-binding protein